VRFPGGIISVVNPQHEHHAHSPPEDASSLNPFALAYQNKFLLFACLVLGAGAGYLFASQKTPIYAASTKLYVERREPGLVGTIDVRSVDNRVDYMATQVEFLHSIRLHTRAVEVGQLHRKLPSFREMTEAAGRTAEEQNQVVPAVAGMIRSNLMVKQSIRDGKATQMLDVSVKALSPEEGKTTLEAIVAAYQEETKSTQKNNAREALEFLRTQQTVLAREVEIKEKAMAKYKDEHQLFDGPDGKKHIVGLDRLNVLGDILAKLEQQKLEAELHLSGIKESKDDPEVVAILARIAGFGTSPSAGPTTNLQDPAEHNRQLALNEQLVDEKFKLDELKVELGDKHPQVKAAERRIKTLETRLSLVKGTQTKVDDTTVRSAMRVAEIRLADLRRRTTSAEIEYNKLRDQVLAQNTKWAEYEVTQHELKRSTNALETLVNKIKDVRIAEDFDAIRVTVVDPVTASTVPVEPKVVQILIIWSIGGLAIGMGLAYLLSIMDHTVRDPEEFQKLTGATLLGMVPLITNRRGAEPSVVGRWVALHPRSTEAEAYRTVRTAVHFGQRTRDARCLLFTSPSQGDGKSVTCANLAASMALNGLKVLLVDADLRRPSQHKIHGLSNDVGLTNALVDDRPFDELVHTSTIPNLDLVSSGPIPPNPAELLSSVEFDKFLAEARKRYDRVLIDAPPTLPVTDPTVLAGRVDGTILVVNSDHSRRNEVRDAARILTSVGGSVVGLIVNMVDSRSGYYNQYYYNRNRYYRANEEQNTNGSNGSHANGANGVNGLAERATTSRRLAALESEPAAPAASAPESESRPPD